MGMWRRRARAEVTPLEHLLPLQIPFEGAPLGRVREAEEIAEAVLQLAKPASDIDLAVSDRPDPQFLISDAGRAIDRPHVAEDLKARLELSLPGPERLPGIIEVDAPLVVMGTERMLE